MPKAPCPTSLALLLAGLLLGACGAPARPGGPPAAPPPVAGDLAQAERDLGPDHPGVARALDGVAANLEAQGRHAEAEPLRRRALAIREGAYGPDHPDVAASVAALARVEAAQGRAEEALDTARRAAAVRRLPVVTLAGLGIGGGDAAARDAPSAALVSIGGRLLGRSGGSRPALLDETFRAGQQLHASDVAAAVARVAARTARGEDALASAIRRWLTLVERRLELDRALVEAADRPPAERSRLREGRLRAQLADTIARLNELNRRIALRFPAYRELSNPLPARVDEVQRLLGADEALLAYAVLEEGTPGEETFAWLLRRDRAEVARLDAAPGELAGAVRELRGQLDPGRWTGTTAPRFDAALAHRLHGKLLPFGADALAGARHLLIVPDGPLQSLPFAVLTRAAPAGSAEVDYRQVDWLARRFATTTLPSVSVLRVLRRLAPPSRAREPFRGVGNPVLTGRPAPARGPTPAVAALLADGLADPDQVRALPPLPETADELQALARNLRAGEDDLLLAERATERAVKGGALAGARVVAFATHAGVAGELPGLAEPALVLTPPDVPSEEDDGVLSVSEAAKLSLDAEFVVLSACNTAAPDGTPGAAGLSGLAKAFLYAGSRSLLVSHWAVLSDAAERLTTGMFDELAREPGLGRAEALRRSEMALLDRPGADPLMAHPAAWAPFVVVGEGGAGR